MRHEEKQRKQSERSRSVFSGGRCLAILFLGSLTFTAQAQQRPEPDILIGLTGAASPAAQSRLASLGAVVATESRTGLAGLKLHPGVQPEYAITVLRSLPDVRYAERNATVQAFADPDDVLFTRQYAPQRMCANKAWEIWKPQALAVIAVIDTGIENDHADLTVKVLRDANGNVVGYDALQHASGPAYDDNGHGTACAGVAAAEINNGLGIAGIAGWTGLPEEADPGFTLLMPVKALNASGGGTVASIVEGMLWAADHGAQVLNLSFGTATPSSALEDAVRYCWNAGCVLIGAAGGSGSQMRTYPAGYDHVLAVACSDAEDYLSPSSNRGTWVRAAAPGVSVLTTYHGGYAYLTGNSFSCAEVAGTAALLLAHNPDLSNEEVVQIIVTTADPLADMPPPIHGGRTNVYAALLAAGP